MGVKLNPFTGKLDVVDSPSGDFNELELNAGTAAEPSIAFAGDSNTGIYSPGPDQLAVVTNGVGRLFVNNSGPSATVQVGIGTVSPSAVLEVVGSAGMITARSSQASSSNSTSRFFGGAYTGNPATALSLDNSESVNTLNIGGGTSLAEPATSIGMYTGVAGSKNSGFERLRITNAGLVGIGTGSPGARLEARDSITTIYNPVSVTTPVLVVGNAIGSLSEGINRAASIQLNVAGGSTDTGRNRYVYISCVGESNSNHGATLTIQNRRASDGVVSETVRVTSAGNVGIGTASPSRGPLHLHQSGATNTYLKLTNGTTGELAGDGFEIAVSTTGGVILNNRESTELSFATAGTDRARIDSDGTFRVKGAGTAGVNDAVQLNGSAPANSLLLDASGRLLVGISTENGGGALLQAPSFALTANTTTRTLRAGLHGHYNSESVADDATATDLATSGFNYFTAIVDVVVCNGDTLESAASIMVDAKLATVQSTILGGFSTTNFDVVNGKTGTDGKFNICLDGNSGSSYLAFRNRMGGGRRVNILYKILRTD